MKATPAAIDSPAEPVVWTMLLRRISGWLAPKSRAMRRKIVIDRTAMGIDAPTVSPILRASQAPEAAKTRPRAVPRTIAPGVTSVNSVWSGTQGENSSGSAGRSSCAVAIGGG